MTKYFKAALLFAPAALLCSACGSPAYEGETGGVNGEVISLYTPNQNDGWDVTEDTPDEDLDDNTPTTTPAPTATATGLPIPGVTNTVQPGKTDKPAVKDFCKKHRCIARPTKLPPGDWKAAIPVRRPDPAPDLYSQIVFGNKVYQVTGYSTVNKTPTMTIRQIGTLESR